MHDHEILDTLRKELRSIVRGLPEDLPVSAHFKGELQLDSLDLVELVARLEQRFGITVPDSDLPEFVSLEATLRYVQSRRPA